ncbi:MULTISPECIES: Uma2 family endonuclease [Streptomyces]|uniref:Putative restriction endonuclease domain-containing protein n=1 Tax=Streptomyces venezuelae TaxID=54571 RepID=A0A5P2BLN6_STRVZ|nr:MULTISPECIES: Uma2 family endonuclease [Streptomyces]NEA04709.1 Uma2 family endonuclease [Streptomyces sp. SID10116]MYY82951.1 Uma2 family endonuclease [Streptomyces sp. SID335]MYZ16878.1 Uma2 family endonuclease [Streptomyces sp. SID337]NDZ86959.1 Uma2 family endonuclease [Streptomyces sp. SID10115]NEB49834.1 Uma2 family endonuclease [Streptomyces sp. SID339]
MDYARMRAIAEELGAYAERLEGSWNVEIGPSGPILAMMCPSKRHEGTVRRIRDQLNKQLPATHPGYVCENGPEIEHPSIGRMRRPDAVVIPEAVLDEDGLAVDATNVLAVVEIVSPSNPDNDYGEKLSEYPAMGIGHYLIVDPRTGTIEVHSEPCAGRYRSKEPYIFGDAVPFGPWTVETAAFRRYEKPGAGAR